MGRMKENPLYNVVSFRVADNELKDIEAKARKEGCKTVGEYCRAVALRKIESALAGAQS